MSEHPHPLSYLPLVGLWIFSSDRYRQLEGWVTEEDEDEAVAPAWMQDFDAMTYDFFGRGYDMLSARCGAEGAEAILIDMDKMVIGLVLNVLGKMTPRPPFYLLFAHVIRHIILQKLPQWWGVNPIVHSARGRLLGLAQRIGESLHTVRLNAGMRAMIEEGAVQIGETWVRAVQQMSDRLTGTLTDLTPLLLQASQRPITRSETHWFAERLAKILGAEMHWDQVSGEGWIDLHTATEFCRIRTNLRFMFATPNIPQQAVIFAHTHSFVLLKVPDFDAPVFTLSPHYNQTLFGMGHLHLLLDIQGFSVSDLWFATV